jgi:pyruvate/2-oxoglutarate dehydrogenase complex dihydrolipoamide dehydrogenase (E3) component
VNYLEIREKVEAMYDIVVLGGGPAGVTAALRARELGAKVALVERGKMGGTCTNDGCAPTRVLARAARLKRETEQMEDYGIVTNRPHVNWPALLQRTRETVGRLHEKKQLIQNLGSTGIDVFPDAGEAYFTDPHTIMLKNGTSLDAEKFIICVGGHGRRIDFPGSKYSLTHSDIWQLPHLPKSIVIIGGAATGCQLASIFQAFGSKVTLLERGPRILGVEDELLSRVVMDSFRSRGIEVICGIGDVEGIQFSSGMLDLRLNIDSRSTGFLAEAVLVAVGWVGNIETLHLENAGVKTERGYIIVNDYLQTTADHIFAAGDVTGRMMLVQSASYDARVAVENAMLGVGQPYKHQIVPHGGFTDPEYASVGLTERKAREVEPECVVATVQYSDLDRAVIDEHTEGFCKLIVSQETHRIMGVHIAGENALEITQMAAAGMASDMWVEQLAELEIAYPTYTAILGLAARQAVASLGVVPMAPEWYALGGNFSHAEWEQ